MDYSGIAVAQVEQIPIRNRDTFHLGQITTSMGRKRLKHCESVRTSEDTTEMKLHRQKHSGNKTENIVGAMKTSWSKATLPMVLLSVMSTAEVGGIPNHATGVARTWLRFSIGNRAMQLRQTPGSTKHAM